MAASKTDSLVKGALAGLAFATTVAAVSVAYAALTSLATVATVGSGDQVSSSEWNKIVSNFAIIDAKLAAVVPTG
jgi:hypothetical protein